MPPARPYRPLQGPSGASLFTDAPGAAALSDDEMSLSGNPASTLPTDACAGVK